MIEKFTKSLTKKVVKTAKETVTKELDNGTKSVLPFMLSGAAIIFALIGMQSTSVKTPSIVININNLYL